MLLFLLPCGFSETAKLAATVSSSPFLRRVLRVASHFDELPLESCHTPVLSQSPGGIITNAFVRVKQDKIQHEYRISRSWAHPHTYHGTGMYEERIAVTRRVVLV